MSAITTAASTKTPGLQKTNQVSLMKVWIDCEWADYRGDLISMALVAEDGREFYRARCVSPELCNEWVRANVLPHIELGEDCSWSQLQMALSEFLRGLGDQVEVIADWPEDIERFCSVLIVSPGQRLSTPGLRFRIVDGDGARSEKPHHALFDARALKAHCLERGL